MKTELKQAINRRLSGFTMGAEDAHRVLQKAKRREEPMKKRLSIGLAIAIAVAALSTLALAAELSGNVFSDLYKRYYGIHLTEETKAFIVNEQPIHVFDFETATFTIDQAVADGFRTYIAASVVPKKDANVIVADEMIEPDDPMVIDTEHEWTQTYQQAADKSGATLMAASLDFTVDGERLGDGSAITSLDKDGRLRMIFEYTSPTAQKQVRVDLEAVMFERTRDGMGDMERQSHAFTLDVMPTEEKTFTVGERIPGSNIIVDSIRLIKAPLTMYYETTYHFEDDAAAAEWTQPFYPRITYFDRNGRAVEHGTVGGATNMENGRIVSRASFDLKELPEELSLMVEGMAPHTYHGYLTVRDAEPTE